MLSKRMRRPVRGGRRRDLGPAPGDGALVGRDHVHAEVERLEDVGGGRRPVGGLAGGDAGEVAHHRELDEDAGAGGGEELGSRPGRLRQGRRRPAAASSSAGVRPAGSTRLPRRVPAAPISTRRPCRSSSTRSCVASSSQSALATLPKPSRQSLTVLGPSGSGSSPKPAKERLTSRGAPAAGAVGARAGRSAAHRTDRERSPTAATSRSSSPSVVYGASPTRTRPPRDCSPSSSTSRWA